MAKNLSKIGKSKYNYINKYIQLAYSKNISSLTDFEKMIEEMRANQLKKIKESQQKRKNKKNYYDYIKSKQWFRLRKAYISTYGNICQICESNDGVHLHHMTYKRLTKEKDTDLLFLCEECHYLIHYGETATKTTKTKQMLFNLYWLREKLGFNKELTDKVVRTNLSMRL